MIWVNRSLRDWRPGRPNWVIGLFEELSGSAFVDVDQGAGRVPSRYGVSDDAVGPVMPELILNPDTAFAILLKAREFDSKVDETDPDAASNASDDNSVDALEARSSDPTLHELTSAIRDLNDDEQLDLIALIWIGRGDFTLAEWEEARSSARDVGRARTPRYVAEIPLVSDYLDEALSQLGFSLEDYIDAH
jgi:hypothetical protein